jgi:hypothetical protein
MRRAAQRWLFRLMVAIERLRYALRRKPLGTCGYSHFVKIGQQKGMALYRVFHCYRDAFHRIPNGQLRCADHEVFPADTFDAAEFQ